MTELHIKMSVGCLVMGVLLYTGTLREQFNIRIKQQENLLCTYPLATQNKVILRHRLLQ